jgi:hypothetical protein
MNTPANSLSAHPNLKQHYVELGVDSLIHGKSILDSLLGLIIGTH